MSNFCLCQKTAATWSWVKEQVTLYAQVGSDEAAGFRVGLAHNNVYSVHVGYLPDTFQTHSRHVRHTLEAFKTPYITFQIPYRHPSDLYIAL